MEVPREDAAGRGSLALVAGVVVLALALHSPCLGWGFLADDYGHQAILQGLVDHPTMKPWSLYSFGTLPEPESELAAEVCPAWWTSPDWMVSFFRPVTSLSLWLDSALFGGDARGFHATGLALYAALLLLAFALYRELGLSWGVAAGALLLYGVEGGSFLPVGWIANRNALLEALFTVLAVWCVARGARTGARGRGLAAGLACALLAALSKESGIAAFALVAAQPLLERRGGVARDARFARAAAVLGAALAVGYLVFLLASGHGARTPFYAVPWHDPLAYAARVAAALPLAALALLTPVASDLAFVERSLLPYACAAGLLLGVPLARAMRRALAGEPAAPLLAAWLVLTFLTRAGAPTGDRLLFVPGVGAAALLALFVARAPRPSLRALRREPLARWSALVIVGAGILSAPDLVMRGLSFRAIADHARAVVVTAEVGPPSLGARDVLLLQSPSALAVLTPTATWAVERPDDPGVRLWALQLGRRGLRLSREGERTLSVTSLGDPFLVQPFERVFVSSDEPPAPGQRWRTAAFEVEALAVEGRGLRTIRVSFGRSLDDPALRLLVDAGSRTGNEAGRLVRLAPPAVGASVDVGPSAPLLPFAP